MRDQVEELACRGAQQMLLAALEVEVKFYVQRERYQVDGNPVRGLEVFLWRGGTFTELTVDRQGLYCKGRVSTSGDGGTVVYQDFGDDRFYAIDGDGANSRALEYAGFNFAGAALTFDGAQMFYCDANAESGRLVQTDASGVLNLFPGWNVTTIAIAATFDVGISRDGDHVFFRFESSSFPFYARAVRRTPQRSRCGQRRAARGGHQFQPGEHAARRRRRPRRDDRASQ